MKVLAIGDSLTEGYTQRVLPFHPYTHSLLAKLEQCGPCTIVNKGKSGEGTSSMVKRLAKLLDICSYDVAIILGGTNDLSTLEPKKVFEHLRKMHDQCRAKGIKTFAITIPELGVEETVPVMGVFRKAVNDLLREYCVQTNIPLIDLALGMPYLSLSADDRALLWQDKVHFTAAGYDRMGELIFEVMKRELALGERFSSVDNT